jgi:hypothetical protein
MHLEAKIMTKESEPRLINIYVAGSYNCRAKIKTLMNALEAEDDIHVLVDWTTHGMAGPEKMREHAMQDLHGVIDADVFVLVKSEKCSRGKYMEAGVAMYLQKPFIVVGKGDIGIFGYYVKPTVVNHFYELVKKIRELAVCPECRNGLLLFKGISIPLGGKPYSFNFPCIKCGRKEFGGQPNYPVKEKKENE